MVSLFGASLSLSPPASPVGSSGTCETICHGDGSCEVKYSIQHAYGGWQKGWGTCVPARYGGSCKIQEYCRIGHHVNEQCGTPCVAGKRDIGSESLSSTTDGGGYTSIESAALPTWTRATTQTTGTCETTCSYDGSCEVEWSIDDHHGHRQWGKGSCFGADFGGECNGIHKHCRIGNHVTQQCGQPCREGKRDIGSDLESSVSTSSSQEPRRPPPHKSIQTPVIINTPVISIPYNYIYKTAQT